MDLKEMRYEAPLTQFLFQKATQGRVPLSGTFELTPLCNFSCPMCYVRQTAQQVAAHPRPMLTLDQWLKLAEEAKEAGMLYLLLTGGEPFLWPDFWPLYDRLIEMGFLVSINSNGSAIDEAAVEKLRRRPPARVNITLYGAGEETYRAQCGVSGMFARVDRAITGLKEAGVLVKLNCSLTPYNARDLEAMNRYAEDRDLILEVNTYMFPPLRRDPGQVGRNERFTPQEAAWYHLERYRVQYGEERYRKFLADVASGLAPPPGLDETCTDPQDGRILCRAGKAAFWVTWDGYLTPCGMMPEPRVDLTGQSFGESWRQLVKKSEELVLSGVCTQCENRGICHSCAAMALAETGSAAGIPKYLCELALAMKIQAQAQLAAPAAQPE